MRMSLRGMGKMARIGYAAGLLIFLVIAMAGVSIGVWAFSLLALVLAACFAVATPFVFARRWQTPEPPAPRRPVRRRR